MEAENKANVRQDGSGETGDETGTKVNGGVGGRGRLGLVDTAVDGLGNLLVHDELGHGVRNPTVISLVL